MDTGHVSNRSSSTSGQPDYEVFLSFRGPDTRIHFTDFLYSRLTDFEIRVFKDDKELEKGKPISPQLIRAIEQSKISIPVISRDYASSNSCLLELKQMLKCEKEKGQIIIPIFYYVNPSDVRKCSGPFERILDECMKRDQERNLVHKGKPAFRPIGELVGFHLDKSHEIYHGEVIKNVVRQVLEKLKKNDLYVPKQVVGVDPHVNEIMAKLKVDYNNGKAEKTGGTSEKVLIYGIPGVGKTVLAKCVYNKLHHLYDACSFLENIQEQVRDDRSTVSVQNKLIARLHRGNAPIFDNSDEALTYIQDRFGAMKVLLLLDDVKDQEQLSKLVGELDWFGPGSTVVVTSQRDDVLKRLEGAENFGLGTMQKDKALTLFCKHAFGENSNSPPENFKELSTKIVAATDGLPLALEKVGKELFRVEKKKVWKETPIKLKKACNESVRAAFFKSYTNLDKSEQQIFLDIACFFDGKDKRIPYYMWVACDFSPSISILSLRAMSLLEIREDKEIRMLGILKAFGQKIVKEENNNEPCKRSRLCNHKEALDVLIRREGTKSLEALGLEFGDGSEGNIFECDRFDGLQNLRFLKLDKADIRGNFRNHFSSLKWLDWRGCPQICMDHLNLNLENLVILDLSASQVHEDWSGWNLLGEARKLKVLKLTGCVQLRATPNFAASGELERLILEGCCNLVRVDPSLSNLNKVVSLNMKGCRLFDRLSDLGPMESLKELVIDGTSISQINVQEGSMKNLKFLSARNCKNLTEISDSIGFLESLKHLALDGCHITTLPDAIGKLRSLQFLDLSYTSIQELPASIEHLKAMKVLRMIRTSIRVFPEAILNLEKLKEIDFSLCRNLEGRIPDDIWRLSSLQILKLSYTCISGLPESISRLSRLRELDIFGCEKLQSLAMIFCYSQV